VWLSFVGAAQIFRTRFEGMRWWGRPGPSSITGKGYGELWGLGFSQDKALELSECCMQVQERIEAGEPLRGLAWDVCRQMYGGQVPKGGDFVTIDDMTEDFDFPVDYDRWMAAQDSLEVETFR
jgi:hypothetical protein